MTKKTDKTPKMPTPPKDRFQLARAESMIDVAERAYGWFGGHNEYIAKELRRVRAMSHLPTFEQVFNPIAFLVIERFSYDNSEFVESNEELDYHITANAIETINTLWPEAQSMGFDWSGRTKTLAIALAKMIPIAPNPYYVNGSVRRNGKIIVTTEHANAARSIIRQILKYQRENHPEYQKWVTGYNTYTLARSNNWAA